MEKLEINTPQNVNIEYGLASIGLRILALMLDVGILLAYIYLVSLFLNLIDLSGMDRWSIIAIVMVLYLPVFFYHFMMETFLGGQTIGKMALKIKVVKIDATRATAYEYFIRWVMNIVDLWMLSGIIGLVSAVASKKAQRIGDLAANTAVINLKPKLNIVQTAYEELSESYTISFPQVNKLSDKDMNIVKLKYQQAIASNNREIIEALCDRLQTVLEVPKIKTSKTKFIQTVIQDHYHTFKNK